MSIKNLSDWADDFLQNYVQPDETTTGGDFLSGESVVLVSGPESLDNVSNLSTSLIPIGMVQNAQLSQGKQVQQLFEIGSRKPYQIPGRVQIQVNLSRVLFDGPSLFYALYRSSDLDNNTVPPPSEFGSRATDEIKNPTNPYPEDGTITDRVDGEGGPQQYANPGRFWSNLRSEIFNRPLGLGFILNDMEGDPYGGLFLEQCYIRGHNMSISAQQTVLLENVNMTATSIRPLSAEQITT